MTPEEPGTQTWNTTQKEQDRERRRLRDRQRRQSMSNEEREKHLARRRRNYQLRRQRTGLGSGDREIQLDSQQEQTSITSRSIINIRNENQEAVVLPECASPDYAVIAMADSCDVGTPTESAKKYDGGMARGVCEVTNSPRRLRVNQIRHLARLLNTPIGEGSGEVQQITDVNAEQSVIKISGSRKSLRLIHVKRLARALNSTMGK